MAGHAPEASPADAWTAGVAKHVNTSINPNDENNFNSWYKNVRGYGPTGTKPFDSEKPFLFNTTKWNLHALDLLSHQRKATLEGKPSKDITRERTQSDTDM